MKTGYEHSWFILNQAIIKREFALSGSEQNPDITNKDWKATLKRAVSKLATGPVEAFKQHGADFVIRDNLPDLVKGMNTITDTPLLDYATVEREVLTRDRQLDHPFGKDLQIAAIRQARNYFGDKMIRTARPVKILDKKAGPLIAVKLNILTRKTLGGLETNLDSQKQPALVVAACMATVH
jgi:predicted oxidoreductase